MLTITNVLQLKICDISLDSNKMSFNKCECLLMGVIVESI